MPGLVARADATAPYTPAAAPPGAAPGSCWGSDSSPAVVETVTQQVLLQPAQVSADGTVLAPAYYKTETQQRIVKERQELLFETPCLNVLTPEFIASLQRALNARGQYAGSDHGRLDTDTRRAIRAFQAPQGLDSSILSIAAARRLGLIAYPRSE
ncbi:peptidoglycan-binding domain-containing protein [Actibacterium mucosum]|uniref:peptidoglycan-binding domain-containing protein n=1 Tax=Actibacterium mucosum TaxID=1087332 RepID=UPI001F167912|nr:peptidoglycan-binding domain-containing protein [Actibacterium mucosum]